MRTPSIARSPSDLHFQFDQIKNSDRQQWWTMKNSTVSLIPNIPGRVDWNRRRLSPVESASTLHLRVPPILEQTTWMRPSVHCPTRNQTSWAKQQCKQRWAGVSGSWLQREHKGSHAIPLASRLSAVCIFPWTNNQAKKRCFPSALACQIAEESKVQNDPANWMSYADLDVYWPLGVHFQVIWSGSSVKTTLCTLSHRPTNSAISDALDILHSPLVQVWFPISSLTVRPFLQASLYSWGAKSLGALPPPPWWLPKQSSATIAKSYLCTTSEKLLIHFRTWYRRPNPRPIRIYPPVPQPPDP